MQMTDQERLCGILYVEPPDGSGKFMHYSFDEAKPVVLLDKDKTLNWYPVDSFANANDCALVARWHPTSVPVLLQKITKEQAAVQWDAIIEILWNS